jgi:mRNA interferase RelE/StbE
MSAFEIYLSKETKAFLIKANKELFERVITRIRALALDPNPLDAKRVIGRKEKVFRVRIGDYRILYVVNRDKKSILIVTIDKRSKVYQK